MLPMMLVFARRVWFLSKHVDYPVHKPAKRALRAYGFQSRRFEHERLAPDRIEINLRDRSQPGVRDIEYPPQPKSRMPHELPFAELARSLLRFDLRQLAIEPAALIEFQSGPIRQLDRFLGDFV